jgi:hypothetical protein
MFGESMELVDDALFWLFGKALAWRRLDDGGWP